MNTTHIPQPGAIGGAGGGKGGTGSYLTSDSTPRGGSGFGAFAQAGGGGQSGETSYSDTNFKDDRRGAGGGGGGFGHDIYYDHDQAPTTIERQCQTLIGMDGEDGFGGGPNGTGAVSQTERAQGGAQGTGPFADSRPGNDFYGTIESANNVLIQGELPHAWAGAGGGGFDRFHGRGFAHRGQRAKHDR